MDEHGQYKVFQKLLNRTSRILFSYEVETASITYLNAAFSYLWNRTRESIMANPAILLETVHPDDIGYLLKEYGELLDGVFKYDVEFRIITPDGTVMWLLLTPQLITEDNGNRIIAGIIEDITNVKDNISNLQKFAAKKNSILEILSHDLAGPLANIRALAIELARSTADFQNDQVSKQIKFIAESSKRSIHLIREFVQQEFLESSKAGMVKRRVNLTRVFEEVMEQYEDGADLIKKQFRFTSSSDRLHVSIDQNKFMQVINNLISNSVKFTRDNGLITVDLIDQETTVLITVKDNGIGIPKRHHSELFEKFSPARREGLKGEPSTGLGMSIIKTIVERHHKIV